MKVYEFQLMLSWLGGIATVIADNKEEAIELLAIEAIKLGWKELKYYDIVEKQLQKGVIQFWDGDY